MIENEILILKDDALNKISELVGSQKDGADKCIGMCINVAPGGCMGITYTLDYVFERDVNDIEIKCDGFSVFIAHDAEPFVHGMSIDYVSTPINSQFVFENPNAISHCGCGKSFSTGSAGECSKKCGECF